MQVDMKALRRSWFFVWIRVVVSQRHVVTRIFPLKINLKYFLLHDQTPFTSLPYRNICRHLRFHCKATTHRKMHWWLNFNVFRVPIQAIPTKEFVSRVSCLFKQIRERIVVEGKFFPRLIQRWMLRQVVFLWKKMCLSQKITNQVTNAHDVFFECGLPAKGHCWVEHRIIQIEVRMGRNRWMKKLHSTFPKLEEDNDTAYWEHDEPNESFGLHQEPVNNLQENLLYLLWQLHFPLEGISTILSRSMLGTNWGNFSRVQSSDNGVQSIVKVDTVKVGEINII